jgi:hypothetical protein
MTSLRPQVKRYMRSYSFKSLPVLSGLAGLFLISCDSSEVQPEAPLSAPPLAAQETPSATKPAPVKNLLPNPDFALGLRGWDHFTNLGAGSIFEVVEQELDGRPVQALRVDLADRNKHPIASTHLLSESIDLAPDSEGAFSIYARAEGGPVDMLLLSVDSKTQAKHELTGKWQRYVLEGKFPAPEAVEAFAIQLLGEGTVFLAQAQFELGGLSDYAGNPEARIGLEVDDGVGLLYPGEEAHVDVWVAGDARKGDRLVAEWTRWGQDSERVLDAAASEHTGEKWNWPIKATEAYGLYTLSLQLERDGKVIDTVEHAVGFVPENPPPSPGDWDSFALSVTMRDLPEQAEKALRMGGSMLRLHGFGAALLPRFQKIADAEPADVEWPLSALVEEVHQKGMNQFPYLIDHHGKLIEGILGNPKQEARLAEFARRLAVRYRGVFQAYQIWNEPEFKVDGDTYAKVHNLMVPALEKGDPEALTVGFGSVHARSRFLEKSVRAGARTDGNEVVAAHFYLNGQPPEQSLPQEMAALFGLDQRVLGDLDLTDAEIWDTESGFLVGEENMRRPATAAAPPSFYKTPALQAAYNVRQQIVGLAIGVDLRSTFLIESLTPFYRWMPHGLFRPDAFRGPRPAAVAYAQAAHHLRDAHLEGLWQDPEGKRFIAVFERDGRTIWVAWTLYDSDSLPLPPRMPDAAFDMLGGKLDLSSEIEIGPTPLYLIWEKDAPGLPGKEGALSDWVSFDPDRIGVETARSETQPPVELDQIVEAESAEFIRWSPGVVRAENASSGRLLALDDRDPEAEKDSVVNYRIILPPGEEGIYEIWVACAPLFGAEYSDLEARVNGGRYRSIRGSDQPYAYSVRVEDRDEETIAWERLGAFELEAGTNILQIRATGKGGQLLDRIGWSKKSL